MQVSAKKLNKTIEEQVFAILFQVVNDSRGDSEVETLMKDLLSKTELMVVAKRLAIAIYLDKGRSYENIKNMLKVSSATIAQVQEKMESPGMQLALKKVKTDEWAGGWSEKLGQVFNQLKK